MEEAKVWGWRSRFEDGMFVTRLREIALMTLSGTPPHVRDPLLLAAFETFGKASPDI
jgi:hypothetical protein